MQLLELYLKKKAGTPAGIVLCGRHRPMFLLKKLYVAQQQEKFSRLAYIADVKFRHHWTVTSDRRVAYWLIHLHPMMVAVGSCPAIRRPEKVLDMAMNFHLWVILSYVSIPTKNRIHFL
jgi:hypothetical protein